MKVAHFLQKSRIFFMAFVVADAKSDSKKALEVIT